ncbi:MAG: DUF3810 domain-containing protein [Prolixibacteraceae bacterium]|jgi:hypothetical protein|nr:DUF3810 domain-containing protein [Prolixibacteraceae bacterium]
MTKNFKAKKIQRFVANFLPFLMAGLTFLLVNLGSDHSVWIEKYYSNGLYPVIAFLLSAFSELLPFSLWDVFWSLFILFILYLLGRVIFSKFKFKLFILRTLQLAALLYTFFYFSWGFNYFRDPIEKRLNWTRHIEKKDMFPTVLDSLISIANASRVELKVADYPAIDSLIEQSYRENAARFGYKYPNGSRRAKTMLYTWFFAKSGVSGYFGPFFNEVHLNGELLPTEYPFVLAHEKAHQFGISGEAEANFMAWYICNSSKDNRLKYSASIQLLQYFFADPFHHEAIREFLKRFDKKAMADIMAQRNHWKELRNETLDKAQTTANNAYLKTNKIHEGVMNYNSVVRLTLEWYLNENPLTDASPSK